VSTLAGTIGVSGYADGQGTAAKFFAPNDVAVDTLGNCYVVDSGNHLIRKITSSGLVSTLAGTLGVSGSTNGQGTAAKFAHPFGIAVNSASGVLYIADTNSHLIRSCMPSGQLH
jgi:DNA-binding beta-propeller fold protein YncE